MLETIIKLKYGYTLDKSKLEDERCPKCGGFVYRVKEHSKICFCSNAFCSWHGESYLEYGELMPWQLCRLDAMKSAFKFGGAIYLKDNSNYPHAHHCVIRHSDVMDYKYIVREWESGEKSYLDRLYDKPSTVVRTYASLELLIKDGWAAD